MCVRCAQKTAANLLKETISKSTFQQQVVEKMLANLQPRKTYQFNVPIQQYWEQQVNLALKDYLRDNNIDFQQIIIAETASIDYYLLN